MATTVARGEEMVKVDEKRQIDSRLQLLYSIDIWRWKNVMVNFYEQLNFLYQLILTFIKCWKLKGF